MLAPRAPGALVCLRCEVRLARPRLPALDRRASHANFSASTGRRNGADELQVSSQAQQSGLRITKEVQPLNRLRRRRGKVIRETSAKLGGIKRLGDDADILVLKEVGDTAIDEPAANPEEAELLDVPDILASLQQDRDLTPEEINKQIESLRPETHVDPSEPHYVTQTTFIKLMRLLTAGFTQQQLSAFYSVAKNIHQEKVYKEVLHGLKGEKGTAKRTVERTEWQPGTTAIYKRLPGLDLKHPRSKRRAVSKQLLVDRILRDVWNLILLEEIEAPGELELSLKPWQITLLNSGENEKLLDKIGRARRVKLQIFLQHSVLRITADKNTAEYAANDIEEALQNTEVKRLQLKPWTPLLVDEKVPKDKKLISLFTQEDLDMVTKLTRTSIQEGSENMLMIRGLDKSAIEEAERTLIRLLPLKDSSIRTIDTQRLDATQGSSDLLPVFHEEKSLDHTYRNMTLGRWLLPVVRFSEGELAQDQAQQVEAAEQPAQTSKNVYGLVNRVVATLRRPAYDAAKPTEEVGNWTLEPEYKLSAQFGQVLFPLEHVETDTSTKSPLSQSLESPFLPTFPGLSSLLTSPNFTAAARTQTPSLIYDFIAAPEQPNFKADQVFPSLHVQMRTGRNGGMATLHKLSLGFQRRTHDVLLPNRAADVRFHRYGRLRFRKSHNDENVQQWIDAVAANIEGGGRLTAPSLRIEIPKWTIPGYSSDTKGMRTVKYLFSGIQFRESVMGMLLGTSVSYSTVQSGKLGAKGGSLTAYYNAYQGDGDALLQNEHTLKAFVGRCFDMVDKITEASAQTLPVSKVVNPRREDSGRRMKRAGQQSATVGGAEHSITHESSPHPTEPAATQQHKSTDSAFHNTVAEDTQDPHTSTGPHPNEPESTSVDPPVEHEHSATEQATAANTPPLTSSM